MLSNSPIVQDRKSSIIEVSVKPDRNSAKKITTGCAIAGGVAFALLNVVTDGKVPGGAIGGAIGGILGGLVGLGINSVRNKQ
jgi:uncharacterized protein YcfJ